MEIWVLWHIPPGADQSGDHMLIGLYSSHEAAQAAAKRLSSKPGFSSYPAFTHDVASPGFFVEAYTVDRDNWTEGYRLEESGDDRGPASD